MYLRTTEQKLKNGTLTHVQIAESVWNRTKKRSETRIICNVGRADDPAVIERMRRLARNILRRYSPEELIAGTPGWRLVDAWSFGDIYVLEQLWERLGIKAAITKARAGRKYGFDVERALFAMVANRTCAPCSKLYCWEQWLREEVRIDGTGNLELHQLYRAMDFLEANKEVLEQDIYFSMSDLLNLDVELIFYDTTSLHFEIDDNDQGMGDDDMVTGSQAAGGKQYKALRKRGHAKNGRSDVPQIVVGLAVTRDGIPVRHWVFPGNTVDVTTVEQVKHDLRGWRLTRCVFVGDAGMVSDDNLKTLAGGGGKYIVAMPLSREVEVSREVLGRSGRYRKVADNLQVKEVLIGKGERRRRYVVCYNPLEARRQHAHRQQVLQELEAELATLSQLDGEGHTKRVCQLRASRRYGKYLELTSGAKPRISKAKVKAAARLDGKFVVHSNDDSLTSEDMALGYKQLMRVEEAWRSLKSGLKLRPVFHWAVHRIHAHVAILVLSLLLQRVAEHACGDTWRNIHDDLKRIKLAHLSGADGELWQVTEPRPDAANWLKLMKIANPPPVLGLR